MSSLSDKDWADSDFVEGPNDTEESSRNTENRVKTAVVLPTKQEPIEECLGNVTLDTSEVSLAMNFENDGSSPDEIRKEAIDVITPLLPTKKSTIISISNQIGVPLISPKVQLTHGKVFGLFPYRVDPGEICCFAINQTPGFPRGVGGLITFELAADTDDKHLCIFVHDPVFGDGSFGFKWKSEIKDLKALADKMDKEKWFNDRRTGQRHVQSDVTGYVVSGTMNHDDPIHLCVEVTDSKLEDSIYMQMSPAYLLQLNKQVKTKLDTLNFTKAVVLTLSNNLDEPLESPHTYIKSGRLKGNLPLRVLPGKTEFFLFQRNLLGFARVNGIVTLELKKPGLKLCIFMSNPALGFNRFCTKLKKQEKTTDANMYQNMESVAAHAQYGKISWEEIEKRGVHVSGFMSQGDPSYLHVIVDNAGSEVKT